MVALISYNGREHMDVPGILIRARWQKQQDVWISYNGRVPTAVPLNSRDFLSCRLVVYKMFVDKAGRIWRNRQEADDYARQTETLGKWLESVPPAMLALGAAAVPAAAYGAQSRNGLLLGFSVGCLAMLVAHRLTYMDGNPQASVKSPRLGTMKSAGLRDEDKE